jgi:hypothetical protein
VVAANIGVGLYEGATSFPAVWLYLVHRNGLAPAIRRDRSQALIGLRADIGKDDAQMSWGHPAVIAADEFVDRFIIPAVERAGIGVFDFCLGPNEHYGGGLGELQYRATAETRIMRRTQYGVDMPDWWEPLAYAWGGVAVGHIEPTEVVLFRDLWLHAWAVNYHGYIGPGRTTLAQETDPYYLWRPLELWLPALRGFGWVGPKKPLRILLGECGTYTSDLLPADARARLTVAIGREFGRRSAAEPDVQFVGPCAYAFGTVGDQVPWRLDGQERMFETAMIGETPPNQPTIPSDGGEIVPEHTPPTLALWVWNWQDAYLDVARRIGASHVLVKAADGADPWRQYSPAAALIRRAGMVPVPWGYNYGAVDEVAMLAATGEQIVCLDPEIEFERLDRPSQQVFCRRVQALRDQGVEVWSACWGQPAVHRDYPWHDLGYAIDRWLPMIAWQDWEPREAGHWLDTWDTAQMGNATPWLPAYDGVTADELVASVQEAQRRYGSASIWAAHTLTAEMVLKLAGAVEKPAPDLNPELARMGSLIAQMVQLRDDIKAKVGG